MMLLVLDKNPVKAADAIPNNLKFKQLLELCQMICSCGYSTIYKKIFQGRQIQQWIPYNKEWVKTFAYTLYLWCYKNINMKDKTRNDLLSIISSLPGTINESIILSNAIFRYSKDYKETIYNSNDKLDIDTAINEYLNYLSWKNKYNKVKRRVINDTRCR